MDTVVTFLVQGARARTAAAQSAIPAAPQSHGQQRPSGGGHGNGSRGTALTPDLLFLNPPSRLALTPIQALNMRRGRL